MPALDGTGPSGMGAATGRGMGPCVGNQGIGFGRGCGRGFAQRQGQGRGFGRKMEFCRWVGVGLSKDEEKDILKQDISDSESYLDSARKRLSELDEQK